MKMQFETIRESAGRRDRFGLCASLLPGLALSGPAHAMRVPLVVFLFVSPGLADWQEHFRLGDHLLTAGKTQDAQRELRTALREADTTQAGLALGVLLDALGRADLQLGNYRSAVKYLERSLKSW